jgi:hypothetical protein
MLKRLNDRLFKEQDGSDSEGDALKEATIDHEGTLTITACEFNGEDPYNNTGKFISVPGEDK